MNEEFYKQQQRIRKRNGRIGLTIILLSGAFGGCLLTLLAIWIF